MMLIIGPMPRRHSHLLCLPRCPAARCRFVVVACLAMLMVGRASAQEPDASTAPAIPDVVDVADTDHANDTDRRQVRYQALIEEAVLEFSQAHYLEARALFRAAHALLPSARTFRGIGVAAFELRDYSDAYRNLAESLTSQERPLTQTQIAEVTGLLERARRMVAVYDMSALPSGTTLLVDGAAAHTVGADLVVLDLGPHRLEIRLEDRAGHATVTVAGGESGPVPVTWPVVSEIPPDSNANRLSAVSEFELHERTQRRRIGRGLAYTGAAAAAVGVAFLALGRHDSRQVADANDGAPWSSLSGAYDRAPRRITTGALLLGAGLSAVGVGITFLVRGRAGTTSEAHVRVGPTGVAGTLRW